MVDAVLLDPALNERQKRVLLDVYASFVRENTPESAETPRQSGRAAADRTGEEAGPAKKTPARRSDTK